MTHPKLTVTLQELELFWSIDDLMMAHGVLDGIEAAEAKAQASR